MPNIFRHIRSRLVVIYFTLSAVTFAALGASFYYALRDSLDKEMGLRLVMVAQVVAQQIDARSFESLRPGDEESRGYKDLVKTLRSFLDIGAASRIYIFDRDTQSLADTQPSVPIGSRYFRLVASGAEIRQAFDGAAADSPVFKGRDGLYYKSAYAPVRQGEDIAALVGVDAGVTFFEALHRFVRNFLFFGFGSSILIIVVSILLALGFERPIARLVQSAQQMAEGDMETSIEPTTRDEIGFLARALDTARGRIVERDKYLQMLQRGIAHEVRNPLGGMRLFCDILTDELADEPEKLDHVGKIRREISSLENVVNEFLDFTRDLPLIPKPVEVRGFLNEILAGYMDLSERKIETRLEIDPEAEQVIFDPVQIRRALYNLLNNAIQAMPQGGVLSLSVSRRADLLNILLTDTGVGIKEENMDDLFRPFYTTKDKGTGLGLPFAKKIIERHKGSVKISSTYGSGTRVEIALPII